MLHMDHDSRVTIDYLRSRPQGSVVRWASDHLGAEQPWSTGWLDVRIPDDGPPDMGWVWTILSPEDPEQGDPEQLWRFPWPPDLEIHSVLDLERGGYAHELPVPVGKLLPASVLASYRRLGSAYRVRGAWSAPAICEALSDWSARRAGRSDLRFEWDPEAGDSPILAIVKERAAARGPTWDLGDGLEVVDGVMDDLLALDPADAAWMTIVLREAASVFGDDAS